MFNVFRASSLAKQLLSKARRCQNSDFQLPHFLLVVFLLASITLLYFSASA